MLARRSVPSILIIPVSSIHVKELLPDFFSPIRRKRISPGVIDHLGMPRDLFLEEDEAASPPVCLQLSEDDVFSKLAVMGREIQEMFHPWIARRREERKRHTTSSSSSSSPLRPRTPKKDSKFATISDIACYSANKETSEVKADMIARLLAPPFTSPHHNL